MVHQVEVEKSRRSNMVHSSINAAPKKGGAGGSYTWGAVADVTDYEPAGFDLNSVGVVTASLPGSAPIVENGSSAPFDVNLQDQEAFPLLATSKVKLQTIDQAASPPPETSPPMEMAEDWVIVTPLCASMNADTLRAGALDLVDGQHPRNLFAKKSHTKHTTSERPAQEQAWAIDWSQVGIPQEVKKQIMKASMNASHQGLYVKEQPSTLPLDMLRAQNAANNHQQNAGSRSRQNSVPRSRSKPRVIQQPMGRR